MIERVEEELELLTSRNDHYVEFMCLQVGEHEDLMGLVTPPRTTTDPDDQKRDPINHPELANIFSSDMARGQNKLTEKPLSELLAVHSFSKAAQTIRTATVTGNPHAVKSANSPSSTKNGE